MIANMVHQMDLEAQTMGTRPDLVCRAVAGDCRPLFETLLVESAAKRAAPFALGAAELSAAIPFATRRKRATSTNYRVDSEGST